MTPEDRTLDGAAVPAVSAGDEAPAGPATDAGAGQDAPAPVEAPAAEASDGEASYHRALDAYMKDDFQGVVQMVDGVLESSPAASLKSRLERLRRRATDRLKRTPAPDEAPAEAPADAISDTPPEGAVTATDGDAPADPAAEAATGDGAEDADGEAAGAKVEEADAGGVDPVAVEAETPTDTSAETSTAETSTAETSTAETSTAETTRAETTRAETTRADPSAETKALEAKPVGAPAEGDASEAKAKATDGKGTDGKADESAEAKAFVDASRPQAERPSSPAKRPAPGPRPASSPGRPAAPGDRRPAGEPPPAARAAAGKPAAAPGPRRPPSGVMPAMSSGAAGPAPTPGLKGELDRVSTELDKLRRTVSGVQEHILKVAEAYGKLAKDGKRKDQAYDQLYEELRQYKDNFLKSAQKPLFLDLILLFDGVRRTLATFADLPDGQVTRAAVVDALTHTRDEILELLYRRDIERIDELPKKLDITFQKPVSRVDTDNNDEDRDIVQVVREGFRWSGNVLRAQEVVVKRCAESGASPKSGSTKERETQ